MGEHIPERSVASIGERTTLESVREVFEKWAIQPQGGDPRIAALSEATLEMFKTDPLFNEAVQFMIEFHEDPDMNTIRKISRRAPDRIHPIPLPLYAAHLIRVAYQNELLHLEGIGYPDEFDSKEKCLEGWQIIISDQERYDNFSSNIAWRNLQTNVADRYKGIKAVIINNQHRFNRPIHYLDVGASMGNGCKKLAINDSFRPIKRTTDWHEDTELLERKPWWNEMLNQKLRSEVIFGKCVGIDVLPGDDKRTKEWIYSCSFYPSELLDESRVNEYTRLEAARPHNFHGVIAGDFTSRSSLANIHKHSGRNTFDVISFVTVLSQLDDEHRRLMLQNAIHALAPDGLIIIQDFVQTDESQPNELIFLPEWRKPYSYRTVVIDPFNVNPRPQEALYWQNSRCEEVRVSEEYYSLLRY
jgi:hypothetical protein